MNKRPNRPVLFLAFANERDDRLRYLRNLPREASGLREVLDREPSRELWDVVERRNATLDEILSVFQDARYRGRIAVFHFAGHAESDELRLESPEGAGVGADAEIFVTVLRNQHSLRLVFLNGCSTQAHAKNLLAAGVPAVIATARAIDDAVATRFAVRFYEGLSGGASVRIAFEEAAASQMPGRRSTLRGVHRKDADIADGRLPWELHVRDGAQAALEWNLGDSAGQPLLGLPPLPPIDLPPKPYRHLNWFGREHAPLFFGRGREIRDLFERLTSSHTPPITLLYGQSGVGKSSLLAAGLLPRLEAVSTTRYVRRDRDVGLLSGLRQAVGVDAMTSLHDAWVSAERAQGRPLIVLLDQIEEAFTRPHPTDPTEIDDFLLELRDVFLDPDARPAGKVMLGFRKEWLADIEDRVLRLMLPHGKVFVDHLDAAGIMDAVAGPARTGALRTHYRLTIEDGLPERIAADLLEDRGSPIAPALQLLLSKLWDRAVATSPESPSFTGDLYTELKREGVLLDDFLEQQLAALGSWQPALASAGLFLDFLAHHTTRIGSARPRSWRELEPHYAHHLALLPELVARTRDLSLLVDAVGIDGEASAERMTRLVHDAVAQLVRRRFEQSDLPGQQARRLLERRARAWAGGASGDTLDDAELSAVESGLTGMRSWTPDEVRLVDASRAERSVREKQEHVDAVVRALLTAREAQDDPLVAALLLAELVDHPEPDESIGTAIRVAERLFPSTVLEGHEQRVNSIAFSPDGTLVATGSEDGTARIWSLDGSGACVVLGDHRDAVTCVAFSPDGRLLATASVDGTALLHRIDQSAAVQPLFGHSGVVVSCVFSPDGRLVATTSTDGTVRVWTCDESAGQRVLAGHERGVRSATFNPLGGELLTLDEAGNARLWNLTGGSGAQVLRAGKPIAAAVFRADGAVVSASTDGEIYLWPFPRQSLPVAQLLSTDALVHTDRASVPPMLCVAQRGSRVGYSVATDAIIIRELEQSDGAAAWRSWPDPRPLRAHGNQILSVAFAPDGSSVIARDSTGGASLWLLSDSGATYHPLTHGGPHIRADAFAPNGDHVATADADGTVRIWPTRHPTQPRSINLPGHFATGLGSCSDGEILVETQPEGSANLFEGVETLRVPLQVGGVPELVRRRFRQLEVSPDRTRLLASSGRRLVVLSPVPGAEPLIVADDASKVQSHRFMADESRLLVHATDGVLHAWNLVAAEHEWKRRGVEEVKYSADSTFVLTRAADGAARLLESRSGDPVWQQDNVAHVDFVRSAAGPDSWVYLRLRDGTSQLRQADGSGRVLRFSEDASPQSSGPPFVATAADGSWVVIMPSAGGSVSVWANARPNEPRLLTNEAAWIQYVESKAILLIVLRTRELRGWKTDQWNTAAPGDGLLIATDVAHLDIGPNPSCGVVQTTDGTLAVLGADLTRVQRRLFAVAGWAWNSDASWIATWSDPMQDDNGPSRRRLWAAQLSPVVGSVALGSVLSDRNVTWADESHLLATVTVDGDPERTPRVGVWDVRTLDLSLHQPKYLPRLFKDLREDVVDPMFIGNGDKWVHRYGTTWWLETLGWNPTTNVIERSYMSASSLHAPIAQLRVAVGAHNRLAAAHSFEGAFWIAVDSLGRYDSTKLVASGPGSVDAIEFSADGQSLVVRLAKGETIRIPTDGSFASVWGRAPDRLVHGLVTADGSVIAMLVSDGTVRVWTADASGPPMVLAAPGRRIQLRPAAEHATPEPEIVLGDSWIAARLDDGTARIWRKTELSSPLTVTEPGRRIEELRLGDGTNALQAVLDDGSRRTWHVQDDRVAEATPAVHAANESPPLMSPDGRHVIRFDWRDAVLVRCDDESLPPVSLTVDTEQRDQFEFSADGLWIVARVTDIGDNDPWALRVWNVNEPDSPRLLANVELVRTQENFLHLRGRQGSEIEIIPFGGTDEPLTVPESTVVIDPRTVMYIGSTPHRGIHIVRIDRSQDPIVLVAPGARLVSQCRYCDEHVVARLANGEICVWDLRWRAVAARVRAATTASLTPELRRRLLGFSA